METLEMVLYSAITILIPLLYSLLSKGLRILARYADAKVDNEYLSGVMTRTIAAVDTAVGAVQQTFVDDLRKGLEDGKLTKEERQEALQRAKAKAKAYLGEQGLDELKTVFGIPEDRISDFLTDTIESRIQGLKNSKKGDVLFALEPVKSADGASETGKNPLAH
jgi:hypothetical protein